MALFDATFAPYHPFGSRTLSAGDAGTDVAVIQSVYNLMIRTMNPPQGPLGAPVPVTGSFDTATVQAVKNIQSTFGLTANGVVAAATYFVFGQGVGPTPRMGVPSTEAGSLPKG